MTNQQTVVSHLYVKVNQQELDDAILGHITEVTVDQHAYLPGMFTLRLYDADLSLLDSGPFDLAAVVEIFSRPAVGEPISLIQGEITALEPHFGEGMVAELLVRGYDASHRLYREAKSKTYLNIKDSDLAVQFARTCQLQAEVETTPTVYEHLYQHNQSDLQFLMQRAWRIGYECFIDAGKLIFRRPVTRSTNLTLAWGEDLISFTPRMTLAEQVEEVIVKGWDVQKKTAITGHAAQGRLYPQIEEAKDGKQWSQALGKGSKLVLVDQPVVSQAEADILAAARLDEISGVFVQADGTAFRRPDIRAGQTVKLTGLGKRFSGAYLVTSANHLYTNAGFSTNFTVTGSRLGLISEQLAHQTPLDRWSGVVPAIVTNTDDPKQWGRIKVKYPWMSEEEESDWVRVTSPGAGPVAGFCAIPAVQDEVLIAFIHGHFDQPVVIGGLWNGQAAPPKAVTDAPKGEKAKVRSWTSRTGHRITVYDNAKNKVEIVTANGHQFELDDAGKKILIKSSGGLKITLDDNGREITLHSSGNVQVNAAQALTLEAVNVQVKATGNLELQASGQVSIKGAMISMN